MDDEQEHDVAEEMGNGNNETRENGDENEGREEEAPKRKVILYVSN